MSPAELKIKGGTEDWFVGWFGFNGPLRLYISQYQAVSQTGRKKREKIDERKKKFKQSPPAPTASAIDPWPGTRPRRDTSILMISRNIRFKGVIWKIIPKLSLLPLLIWSTSTSVLI